MNEALKEIINRIKQELHDRPDGVIVGEINNGFKGDMIMMKKTFHQRGMK